MKHDPYDRISAWSAELRRYNGSAPAPVDDEALAESDDAVLEEAERELAEPGESPRAPAPR